MAFKAKAFAGSHCGCRYQQDYRPTLGRDGKKESGTLEVIKFYYDGAIRMEQHCYGEAATFVFGVWASGMDPDGTLHWNLPDRHKSYYDEDYLPQKLDRVDEAGNLYFDGSPFPWKLADDFAEDPRWGLPPLESGAGQAAGQRQSRIKRHAAAHTFCTDRQNWAGNAAIFAIHIDTVGILGYKYSVALCACGWQPRQESVKREYPGRLARILSDERTGFKWKIKPPAACSRLKRSSISTMPPRLPAHPRCWLSWSRP